MKIPRKFEGYQPDVYPPTFAGIPSMSNEDWRCGQNSNPMLMSLEPGNPVLSKTEFKTWEIDSAPKTTMGVSPSPYSPRPSSPEPTAHTPSSPRAGYTPKQGKMTVEDVEEEMEMLMKRMEFLNETLQQLKKENAKNL